MSSGIHVTLKDNSAEVMRQFHKQVEDGLLAIGATAEGYAKDECPVDTGRLRGSITFATEHHHSKGGKGADSAPMGTPEKDECYIGTNVEYAKKIEYMDMPHKVGRAHFLRDATTTHGDEYKNLMEAALKK